VRREVREEAGLDVEAIHYRASQPWPFPSSLMLGFRAETRNGAELRIDGDELEDARWFGRTEVAEIRSLGLRLPFRGTIARALIEAWLAGDEAGYE
jgi:NAD+ diphosphatase